MTARRREREGGKKRRREREQGMEGEVWVGERREAQNRVRTRRTHIVCYQEGISEKQILRTSLYLFIPFSMSIL